MAVNVTGLKLADKTPVVPNHSLMEVITMTHQPNEVKAAAVTAAGSVVIPMDEEPSVIVRELPNGATTLTAAEREQFIAETAYRIAELRGFGGGHELDDWLEAEKEVDAMLAAATERSVAATMRKAS